MVGHVKKRIYLLILICELAFCNELYACSTCLWEITDFFFPSLLHWFAIGFIWMIIQVTTDHTFKVKHAFNLTFLRFLGLSFLTFIIAGALLITFLGENPGNRSPIIIGLLGLALIVALDKGWNRTTLYAIFIPVFFIVGFGLNVLTPTIIILVGGVLMVLGAYLFARFLKKYPENPGEESGN